MNNCRFGWARLYFGSARLAWPPTDQLTSWPASQHGWPTGWPPGQPAGPPNRAENTFYAKPTRAESKFSVQRAKPNRHMKPKRPSRAESYLEDCTMTYVTLE